MDAAARLWSFGMAAGFGSREKTDILCGRHRMCNVNRYQGDDGVHELYCILDKQAVDLDEQSVTPYDYGFSIGWRRGLASLA
jgi:hypothetical protein